MINLLNKDCHHWSSNTRLLIFLGSNYLITKRENSPICPFRASRFICGPSRAIMSCRTQSTPFQDTLLKCWGRSCCIPEANIACITISWWTSKTTLWPGRNSASYYHMHRIFRHELVQAKASFGCKIKYCMLNAAGLRRTVEIEMRQGAWKPCCSQHVLWPTEHPRDSDDDDDDDDNDDDDDDNDSDNESQTPTLYKCC